MPSTSRTKNCRCRTTPAP